MIVSGGNGPNMVFTLKTVEDEKIEAFLQRQFKKYKYNGELYGKDPLVREVVKQCVTGNPKITLPQLKDIFLNELLRRYRIFEEEKAAREISGKRDRYFLKPEHLIQLKKEKIAVCSQFTFENIQPFMKLAKAIGYKIK